MTGGYRERPAPSGLADVVEATSGKVGQVAEHARDLMTPDGED